MAAQRDVLVVADGDVDSLLLGELLAASGTRPLVIAADGGAARASDVGIRPDLVIGDIDSLSRAEHARLEHLGIEVRVAATDKDESDMELCLLAALETGARRITILGALGIVRPEHSVANLLLLADPRLDGRDVVIAGRGSRIMRTGTSEGPGEVRLRGEAGDYVSLFPLGDAVEGVTTQGLRFALSDETLRLGPSRGLSNELLGPEADVTSRRGRLLVIHTHRSMSDAPPLGGS